MIFLPEPGCRADLQQPGRISEPGLAPQVSGEEREREEGEQSYCCLLA